MSRPLNKSQLLAAAQKEYAALEKFLATLSPQSLTQSPAAGGWAVKDILAHLYEWQEMFFTWYEAGLRGETPSLPAPGYKWSQLPALNQSMYEKNKNLAAEEVMARFRASHQKTIQFIENLPEVEMLQPGLYRWMNNNTLLAYLHANTDAHYAWALKDCKKLK